MTLLGKDEIVRLPKLLSDGMVLQRKQPIVIWGWAHRGQKIQVHFMNHTYPATADQNEKWSATLPPQEAGGPYSIEISADPFQKVIRNILVGDVWVCSGQSNMQLPMARVKDQYPDVIANDENTYIRQFCVPMKYDFQNPCSDLESGLWEPVNHHTIFQFSAAGYFFAKELYKSYSVPIGLINTAIGGSPVEAWLSRDALKKFPAILKEADQCRDSQAVQNILQSESQRENSWYASLDARDPGLNGKTPWYAQEYDDSEWSEIQLPSYWADKGVPFTNGSIWFRRKITVPDFMAGTPAKIWMGRIVDWDRVYVNGTAVGCTTYQYPPRKYEIPGGLLREGENTITVRVISNRGKGGFITEKPYRLFSGDWQADLTGPWKYHIGAKADPLPQTTFFQYKPLGLFNGMLAPLLNYTVKGIIWYQGEANTDHPGNYRLLFESLVRDWRKRWKQGNLPFLFVQLPNYLERENHCAIGKWPLLREAQLNTLSVPGTAMAVTIDIGEWNDLHPLNKQDVGKRLAQAAKNLAYGEKNLEPMGPIYDHMQIHGDQAFLTFSHIGSGLIAKGGGNFLNNFEMAGSDGIYYPADAYIQNNLVAVRCSKVPKPFSVRYAWSDSPRNVNFYNREGLPASPFRTTPIETSNDSESSNT